MMRAWPSSGPRRDADPTIACRVSINVDAWLAEHAEAEAREQERLAKIQAKKEARSKPVPKRKRGSEAVHVNAEGQPIGEDGAPITTAPPAKKKKPETPPKKEFPCILCPEISEETLVRVEEVTPGKKPKMAHRVSILRPAPRFFR